MFGTRDEFEYLECPNCGTVQIADVPDLEAYYPKSYYSFEAPAASPIKEGLANAATDVFYRTRNLSIANRVFELFGADARLIDRGLGLKSVLRLDPAKDARILDVGCGSAELLRVLARLGFTALTGIDKFLREDSDRDGVKLRAAELSDLDGRFDLIMFHHSLEHMADPVRAQKVEINRQRGIEMLYLTQNLTRRICHRNDTGEIDAASDLARNQRECIRERVVAAYLL